MKLTTFKLKDNYNNFEEWLAYSQTYGLAARLGFKSEEAAWEANPTVQMNSSLGVYRAKKEWPKYKVSFWNHVSNQSGYVNDCFGNSIVENVLARTEKEAIRKVSKSHSVFRLRKVSKAARNSAK